MKKFFLTLNKRPFQAIKSGTKTIEIRANKKHYREIKPDDIIVFENNKKSLECIVERKTLYPSVKELLLKEGTKQTLSSTNNLEQGIKSVESISNYKELITRNGVFAIKLKNVKRK